MAQSVTHGEQLAVGLVTFSQCCMHDRGLSTVEMEYSRRDLDVLRDLRSRYTT